MKKLTKIYLILSTLYIAGAIVAIAANSFSLTKSAERYRQDNFSCGLGLSDYTCMDTDDFRTELYFLWPSWQFMSDGKGNDAARYIPADVVTILIIDAGIGIIYALKRRSKTTG